MPDDFGIIIPYPEPRGRMRMMTDDQDKRLILRGDRQAILDYLTDFHRHVVKAIESVNRGGQFEDRASNSEGR